LVNGNKRSMCKTTLNIAWKWKWKQETFNIKAVQKATKNRRATRPGHIKMKPIKYGENISVQFFKYINNDIEKGNTILDDGIIRIYR
jgi:hypothetical protein